MTAQSLQALEVANERRTAGAQLKRDLFDMGRDRAEERIVTALRARDPRVGALAVAELLAAPRGCGRQSAHRILVACQVPPYRRLRELTDRQRDALVARVREGLR